MLIWWGFNGFERSSDPDADVVVVLVAVGGATVAPPPASATNLPANALRATILELTRSIVGCVGHQVTRTFFQSKLEIKRIMLNKSNK